MSKFFFYDKRNDILSIHKGFKTGETFKTNIDIGSVVLDISNKGRVIGLEIMSASDILKKEFFENDNIDFNADITPKNILIKLTMKGSHNFIPAIIAVPLEKPLII